MQIIYNLHHVNQQKPVALLTQEGERDEKNVSDPKVEEKAGLLSDNLDKQSKNRSKKSRPSFFSGVDKREDKGESKRKNTSCVLL